MNAVAPRILFALLVLLSTGGCGDYPKVTVVNESGGSISGITVELEDEGHRYNVGALGNGERTTISVEPNGESSLTLEYITAEGTSRREIGGYLEESGGYHLTLTIQKDGGIEVDSTVGY